MTIEDHEFFPTHDLDRSMQLAKNSGMNVIFIQSTARLTMTPDKKIQITPHADLEKELHNLLAQADTLHQKIFLGTALTDPSILPITQDKISVVLEKMSDFALELAKIAKPYKSFHGWYISDEPGDVSHPDTISFTKDLVLRLKKIKSAPVAISPYLLHQKLDPESLAKAALTFHKKTEIDLQLWQDSEGSFDRSSDEIYTSPLKRKLFFKKLFQKMPTPSVGTVIEVFNRGSGSFGTHAFYRSASTQRIVYQVKNHCKKHRLCIPWLPQFHFWSGILAPHEQKFFESTRLFASLRPQKLQPIQSMEWITTPDKAYKDQPLKSKLLDQNPGDPAKLLDGSWVGVLGSARFKFTLPQLKKIDWIGVQVAHAPTFKIQIPQLLKLICLDPGAPSPKEWEFKLKFHPQDSDQEYLYSNDTPLQTRCKSWEIQLENHSWTFIGELEVTVSP